MADGGADFPTTLGADANFKGQLQFEKGARLLGKFEGEVTTKGEFVIAEGADFSGEARAGNVRVEGGVKGNLNANGKIQLTASARLEGDITAARLEVAEGAAPVADVAPKGRQPTEQPVPAGARK
jgi:cytoskeletal protein CcmA (bactofilin family)